MEKNENQEDEFMMRNWRSWGSWFSWGSPVGVSIFFISISIVVLLFRYAFVVIH